MTFRHHTIQLRTVQPLEIIDITSQVRDFAGSCGVKEGLVVVASRHTTLGVVVNERCERLQQDMIDFLKRLAPPDGSYHHNLVATDGRPNAHSHLLSLVIPSQATILVSGGKPQLGQWQSVFAVELDGPRESREIILTAVGG